MHDAIKWVADELDAGLDLIDYVFTVVTNGIQSSLGVAWNILNGMWSWIVNAASTVGGWIDSAFVWWWDNVVSPAINFAEDVAHYIGDALSFAINLLQGALDWAINNLVIPALHWIEGAATTVGGWIWDAIEGFYHDVILPFVHDLESVYNEVAQLADFVWHTVLDVVHAVMAAWDWIIWFGEHTFSDILHLLEGTDSGLSRDWLLGAASDPNGWGGKLADDLARILG